MSDDGRSTGQDAYAPAGNGSVQLDDPLAARLRAALEPVERAPIPPDLVDETLAAALGQRQARRGPAMTPLLAAAAAVALLVVVVVPILLRGPAAASPATSPLGTAAVSAASPSPSPPASPVASVASAYPDTMLGLPVIGVDAAAALARGIDPPPYRPLAVAGWLWSTIPANTVLDCRTGPVLLHSCQLGDLFMGSGVPSGTSSVSLLSPLLVAGVSLPVGVPTTAEDDPTQVIVIGHFSDPRVDDRAFCTLEARPSCAGEFVIDAVPWVDGHITPTTVYTDPTNPGDNGPAGDVAALVAGATKAVPDAEPLGIVVARPSRLAGLDPVFAGKPQAVPEPGETANAVVRMVRPTGYVSVEWWGSSTRAYEPAYAFPFSVDGLPVLGIREAIAARDDPARTGPERVAVRGWYTDIGPVPCPVAPPGTPTSPLLDGCPLALNTFSDATASSIGATLAPIHIGTLPGYLRAGTVDQPSPVILVGHFHDPAAASCDASIRAACEQSFVVERVAWARGAPTTPPTGSPEPAPPEPTPAPTPDLRLGCHDPRCSVAAGLVEHAEPAAYAAAARIVVVGPCAPWIFCALTDSVVVVLVPPDWVGDPAGITSFAVSTGQVSGSASVTRLGELGGWQFSIVAGYIVTCDHRDPAPCYERAMAVVAYDWQRTHVAPQSITVTGPCGNYDLLRVDGTGQSLRAICLVPASPSPSAGQAATPPP